MKKRYNVNLDVEPTEVVMKHLATLGMSFSGFMNAIINEFAKEIQGQPVVLNKKVEELTIKEFGELASYWMKKASED